MVDAASQQAGHVEVTTAAGDLAAILTALADRGGDRADHEPWIARLRDAETAAAERDRAAVRVRRRPHQAGRASTAS